MTKAAAILILKICIFLIISFSDTHQSKIRTPKEHISDEKKPVNIETIRNLYNKINKRDVKNVTTVAMLHGTISTGQKLKENLEKMMIDLKTNLESNSLSDNKQKIKRIAYTMNRDRKAFEILYKIIMTGTNKNVSNNSIITTEVGAVNGIMQNKSNFTEIYDLLDLQEYIDGLQQNVDQHIQQMKESTDKMTEFVMKFFENSVKDSIEPKEKLLQNKSLKKPKSDSKPTYSNLIDTSSFFMNHPMNPFMYNPYNNWPFAVGNLKPSEGNKRREDIKDNDVEELDNKENDNKKNEEQVEDESESESSSEESGPGGLAGLIASLSGGDMGSDVGALLGAVSGVVTNIFGPDGLDIESLISTGTGLIGGLLGGEENVGKVFSNYLGAALEGFSGGGGADNNGLFIGNFLGGTLAKLSADPEDDDAPIRPDIFLNNFAKGLNEGLGKSSDDRDGDNHGSDSFSFIGKFISSAVAGIVNLIVQAILGSIGGSSEGSAGLSGSSSEISKGSSTTSHHDPGLKPPSESQGGYY